MGENGSRISFDGLAAEGLRACQAPQAALCTNRICGALAADLPSPRQRELVKGARLLAGSGFKIWTVVDGLVALCTALPDGRRQLLSLATPGDVITPLDEEWGAGTWVEALAPSRLCEFDLSQRALPMEQDPVLSAELFRIAHRQVRNVSTHLVLLGRLDGMERICLFLTDMAWRIGVETPGGWRVNLPLSREDIADYLGLNAETVSRILSRVKKSRLVTFLSPTDYIVADITALQSRAPVGAPHAPATYTEASLGVPPL